MADGAKSDDPALQAQLNRINALSPGRDTLGLDRVTRLLERLGNPHLRLPPVFHVAGTNGKGSTCAYLRACLEAAGLKTHLYTSPHLVRFNERIRLAGRLIDDEALASLLAEALDANGDEAISFFEVTTAAAFLAFSRTPADACVIEVGLGGRLDATNVIPAPVIGGIAQLGVDHQAFLGETLEEIAREKAGIAKPGTPVVLSRYADKILAVVADAVRAAGGTPLLRGDDWETAAYEGHLHYRDGDGRLELPLPRLAGQHQLDNAGLAVAMLRHQRALAVPAAAIRAGLGWAEWPARMQRLESGPLNALLPAGTALWLDGGHNPAAGRVIADTLREQSQDGRPALMVLGMLSNKDAAGFLKPFAGHLTAIYSVPVPDHECHSPQELAGVARAHGLAAIAAANVTDALIRIGRAADSNRPPLVLIAGSLYLAGEVLRENCQPPE